MNTSVTFLIFSKLFAHMYKESTAETLGVDTLIMQAFHSSFCLDVVSVQASAILLLLL